MKTTELLRLAERLLSLPTAPYHEHAVRALVTEYCRILGLRVERDAAGNVFARYQQGARGAPLVLVAHMDHPGFEALGPNRARFLGGVPKEMFRRGAGVRFYTADGVVQARIRRRLGDERCVELAGATTVRRGDFGSWDLTEFRQGNGKIWATNIDDVLGVGGVLATLAEVTRRRWQTHVWGVFTRAEEVGFPGAVVAARAGRIPRAALVVSVETSKERPWAQIGNGPVIRVGDRTSVFDPSATWFFTEVARRAAIRAQRCLMDGGTCEATAFAAYGYRVGGLCLALGNYHNIGPGKRPAPEYVSADDLEGLVELASAAARYWPRFEQVAGGLRQRVKKVHRLAPRRLKDE